MLRKLSRILKYRLLVPILRSNLPPVETARGVAVGLVSAMNPFVGIQMALVGAFWAFQKLVLPNWRFNLIAALAWTWVTNIFTVPIVYYVFLITGSLMLGRWEEFLGFDEFAKRLEDILSIGGGGVTAAWDIMAAMVSLWGIPLFIGCIPWAIFSGLVGYYWTLKYQESKRRRGRSIV